MELITEKLSNRIADVENELKVVAETAQRKVGKHMFFRELLDALPQEQRRTQENFRKENLERMEAYHWTYRRDRLALDCQSFLYRICILLSVDFQCWRRGLLLKGFATSERGWDLEGTEYSLMSVARVEESGDVLGFYSRLNAVLTQHRISPNFQVGDYDYEWEPVKQFTLHRLNLCDPQPHPWLARGLEGAPARMGYEGMGRRMIRPGQVLTSRWTKLCQGNKVAYIERPLGSNADAAIVECTVARFYNKFKGVEGVDSEDYRWGKCW
jgi:hypothetical protein